jgi:hypothetical protein
LWHLELVEQGGHRVLQNPLGGLEAGGELVELVVLEPVDDLLYGFELRLLLTRRQHVRPDRERHEPEERAEDFQSQFWLWIIIIAVSSVGRC